MESRSPKKKVPKVDAAQEVNLSSVFFEFFPHESSLHFQEKPKMISCCCCPHPLHPKIGLTLKYLSRKHYTNRSKDSKSKLPQVAWKKHEKFQGVWDSYFSGAHFFLHVVLMCFVMFWKQHVKMHVYLFLVYLVWRWSTATQIEGLVVFLPPNFQLPHISQNWSEFSPNLLGVNPLFHVSTNNNLET